MGEATLAEHATNFDPRRLRVIARRIIDQLDPDGPAPRDEPDDPCPAAGELHIRDRRDGGISLEGWLDALHGTAFRGLIEQLAKPRPLAEDIPDPRTAAQRNADALVEICDLARGHDQMPAAPSTRYPWVSAEHWSPETADVLSRAVTVPPHCATLTTSGSGITTVTPK